MQAWQWLQRRWWGSRETSRRESFADGVSLVLMAGGFASVLVGLGANIVIKGAPVFGAVALVGVLAVVLGVVLQMFMALAVT